MRKLFLFLILFGIVYSSFSQQSDKSKGLFDDQFSGIAKIKSNGKVLEIKKEFQVPAQDFFNQYRKYFSFMEEDQMIFKQVEGQKGVKHYRYNQYYNELLVKGATLILHEKDGLVYKVNGNYISGISLNCQPAITQEQAIQTAIQKSESSVFAWQVPALENDLKEIKKDMEATYYPSPQLIIYDKNHSFDPAKYRLTYEIEIVSAQPLSREVFYINAQTGEIIHSVKKNHNVNVEAQATTQYDGVKTITVDSVSSNYYVLRSSSRGAGNGILTRTLNNWGSYYEVPIESSELITSTTKNFSSDKAANSAHYGAEKTYDYYYTKFNRNSFDDQGTQLLSYVHWGDGISNAMWYGSAMVYGDGPNNSKPYTLIEVCGHEISHGVTQHTAGLDYEYESGALNEAFSDMFGAMIYYYATNTLKWTIGDEIRVIRNMANPKQFENPNTYQGQYWHTSSLDNGGVHTNSGVANYWFYLLTAGGQGVNDLGNAYNIPGIGAQKSETIAYEALAGYLTFTSQYEDAYIASLEAAEDLYGSCSPEYLAVANAWYAVGIGERLSDEVFLNKIESPITSCVMSDREQVKLKLSYNSCGGPLPSGSRIHIKIKLDQTTTIFDTITLTNGILSGGYASITLNKTVNLSAIGNHRLDIWIKRESSASYSDSIINYQLTNRAYQNSDLGIAEVISPETSCQLSENTPITVKVFFNGCDLKPAGDTIRIVHTINDAGPVAEKIILQSNFTKQDTLEYTFTHGGNFTQTSKNVIKVFTDNGDDENTSNNQAEKTVYRPISLNDIEKVGFEETPASNYYYTEVGPYAATSTTSYSDRRVLRMTGGNILEYFSELDFPELGDLWGSNSKMSAKATFCVDARNLESLTLRFDLRQTSGKDFYQNYIQVYPDDILLYSSMLRILVNGRHVGNTTYKPNTATSDSFVSWNVDLSAYVGDLLDITFESRCLGANLTSTILDNVYIDNVSINYTSGITNVQSEKIKGSIYPNPGTGNYIIKLESAGKGNIEIDIFDLMGKKVFSQSNTLTQGLQQIPINLNQLNSGVYTVVISSKEGKSTYKIIKQ